MRDCDSLIFRCTHSRAQNLSTQVACGVWYDAVVELCDGGEREVRGVSGRERVSRGYRACAPREMGCCESARQEEKKKKANKTRR